MRKLFLALLVSSGCSTAFAQNAVLHLRCEGEAAGSFVFINGKAQGKCPNDIAVPAGPIKLKVMKILDLGHYRHFTTELSLAAGATKNLTVVLGDQVYLTPQGRKEQLAAAKAKAATAAPAQQSVASSAQQQQQQLQRQLQLQQQERQRQLEQQQQQQQQAAIAQQAEAQAQPSQVKGYLDSMSTQGNAEGNPSSATIATSYAPLLLPILTTSDISQGNSLAQTDPAAFGNPDSMVAKAARLQEQRASQPLPLAVAQQ